MAEPARLLIIGDSQSVALKEGCDALGIAATLLSFSGNFWHAGAIGFHRKTGIRARSAGLQARVKQAQLELGRENLLAPGSPVLVTFGFHLGRVVPPFGFGGHLADGATFLFDEKTQFASSGLIAAYARAFRQGQIDLLARIAGRTTMCAVTPPRLAPPESNHAAFFAAISAQIVAAGVPLFDPCEELFGPGEQLPVGLRTADGNHGTASYGKAVIERMAAKGLIPISVQ